MGIKCSLLGHDFGEATVERDREEQGSEVVITIREVEACTRCGETRIVSENKEVTSLATPEEVEQAGDAGTDTDSDADAGTGASEESTVLETGPDHDGATTTTGSDGPSASTGTDVVPEEAAAVGDADPATDDAEILDESDSDRDPGEWPGENDDEESFDQFEYSDPETDREEDDTEFVDADAEFVDDDAEDGSQTNAWPSEDESPDPTGPGAVTVPEGTFVCDDCGFSTPVEESSLREGDFCPECHGTTLVQVREDERRNE